MSELPEKLQPFWRAPAIAVVTACIVGEAEGESFVGKLAVACVIRNRVSLPWWWGTTYHDVCLMKHQFSCFWSDFAKRERVMTAALTSPASFRQAYQAAEQVMVQNHPDVTGGATHYFNRRVVVPTWARHLVKTCRIGRHDFYRE